jgi:hypothetical protein
MAHEVDPAPRATSPAVESFSGLGHPSIGGGTVGRARLCDSGDPGGSEVEQMFASAGPVDRHAPELSDELSTEPRCLDDSGGAAGVDG